MAGLISPGTMHAFIIEDDYLIGQVLQDMLEDLGFETFSFARSEDAAVMGANAQSIDLITADVRLLPGDGLRAVEAICKERAIPVVFITGYAEELEDRAPGATVIQKPVKQEELAAAVRAVLSKHGQTADR
jgi:DNA-binding response OmpR family regulator